MKKSKAFEALEKVALKNGISIAEVYKEIELAIDVSMASSDPEKQVCWEKMLSKRGKPTPEEVIICLTEKIKFELDNERME